jgi:isocitrate lyase
MGGKVLVPTSQHLRTLAAARLATDVCNVPTLVVARTDALDAVLLTSDADPRDRRFCTGKRSPEGYYHVQAGMDVAVARGLAYAPYADLIWCETSTPDLHQARTFAESIKAEHPDQMLAYNCSPSFNWKQHLDDPTIARFQKELGAMGYGFQFVTLAGWHALNEATFTLAHSYAQRGMTAYVDLQQRELGLEGDGYTATRHQREVGAGYFDDVMTTITDGHTATLALAGSTEEAQFGHNR